MANKLCQMSREQNKEYLFDFSDRQLLEELLTNQQRTNKYLKSIDSQITLYTVILVAAMIFFTVYFIGLG